MKLVRAEDNPIITPRPGKSWEKTGTFNPGAVADGDTIHLLYRATDTKWISRLGYARTADGTTLTYRSSKPVLSPTAGGEYFGCEDPRITRLDGVFYVTYTAYSKRGPRLALAETEDFCSFKKLGVVGPNRNDKDFVLFPERVGGKIAALHRLESEIQLVYFDTMSDIVSPAHWAEHVTDLPAHTIMRGTMPWEERKIGAGPPPIKTERGWLLIYHGVSLEKTYSVGAALLRSDNPSEVVARTRDPILKPEAAYESYGVVQNVVFPSGAVVLNEKLLVYYGGADKVCGVASATLDVFLDRLAAESP